MIPPPSAAPSAAAAAAQAAALISCCCCRHCRRLLLLLRLRVDTGPAPPCALDASPAGLRSIRRPGPLHTSYCPGWPCQCALPSTPRPTTCTWHVAEDCSPRSGLQVVVCFQHRSGLKTSGLRDVCFVRAVFVAEVVLAKATVPLHTDCHWFTLCAKSKSALPSLCPLLPSPSSSSWPYT
jgi:hypothetical protein